MALTKKAERTKAKLLESAKRLISAHGFDHVSVEDITKDSGVAKGTFYHYFECKEDVVRELSRKTAMATIERAIAHEGDVIERCCISDLTQDDINYLSDFVAFKLENFDNLYLKVFLEKLNGFTRK